MRRSHPQTLLSNQEINLNGTANARSSATSSRRGFTIVEILVVVGITAVLVGLLLPALSGVRKRARKAVEINNIRQVGLAWNSYAVSNNDYAPPGYITDRVQERWKVSYEYPDHMSIPPAPDYAGGLNIAGPWTWRLMPYLGYNLEVVAGFVEDDSDLNMTNLYDSSSDEWIDELALAVAENCAFGYNGYYVGGYWELYNIGNNIRPAARFFDVEDEAGIDLNPIAKSAATMRKPSELITFCSSSVRNRPDVYGKANSDTQTGHHLVEPPWLGRRARWSRPGAGDNPGDGGGARTGGTHALETLFPDTAAPLGRYTGLPAIFFGDGHVESQTMGSLFDQRKWLNITREVDGVDPRYFRHSETKSPRAP